MAKRVVLTGAQIKLYINNKLYKEVQSVAFTVDYGEYEVFGIDADYAQEIAPSKTTVRGSIQGLRVRLSGGLQAYSARPLYKDRMAGNYVSIRIMDRSTDEDIIYVQNAKVTRENHSVGKGSYKLSFEWIGQIPYMALDRS